jgi:hypothetical protein
LILDEAQQLPTKAIDAMFPTLSAMPNPQVVFTGTVPAPEMEYEIWERVMRQGRAGTSRRLAWMEWNYGERLREDQMDLLEVVLAANPAFGIRMNRDFIDEERDTLSHMGYLRERLSIWSDDPLTMVIPMSTWVELEDAASKMVGRRAIAVDCPPLLGSTVIGAMGRREDGAWHGEVIEQHPGTDWAPVRVGEIVRKNEDVACVVVDPASPAGALIPDIEAEGVEVMTVSQQQHAQACGMLYTRATGKDESKALTKGFRHLGDPILTDALKAAVKRPTRDGAWMWNRKDSGDDISPLVAVTLAGYGLSTLPEVEADPWGFFS